MVRKFKPALLGTVFCAAAAIFAVPASALEDGGQGDGQEQQAEGQENKVTLKEALEAFTALQNGATNAVTADSETGKFEIDILTQAALAGIAQKLGDKICGSGAETNCKGKRILVLGESETFAFGLSNLVAIQLNDYWARWEKLPENGNVGQVPRLKAFLPVSGDITKVAATMGELFKLVRNERGLKSITSTAVDEQMLVNATAASLSLKQSKVRVLNGSAGVRIAVPDPSTQIDWNANGQIALKLAMLLQATGKIDDSWSDDAKNWKTEFDVFFGEQSKPASDSVPSTLGYAISADAIESELHGILSVKLGTQGGSFVTHTNFFTTVVGTDPFRVSGGLSASFTYSHARPGEQSSPVMWMMITCSTDDMHLDAVRKADFTSQKGKARCADPVTVGAIPD